MNLHSLSDDQLHITTIEIARREREITLSLLKHLHEVERRHLFSKHNCSSLFAYCVNELKMSDGQAGRRVSAARLLKDVPAIEEKILDGSLPLTNVAQAALFFKKEKRAGNQFDHDRKLEILNTLMSASSRQVEQILISNASQEEIHFRETCRVKTTEITEVKLHFDRETLQVLDRLKQIWSHAQPNAGYAEIVKRIALEAVDRHDPLQKAERARERKNKVGEGTAKPKNEVNDASHSEMPSHKTLSADADQPSPTNLKLARAHTKNTLLGEEVVPSKEDEPGKDAAAIAQPVSPAQPTSPAEKASFVRHQVRLRDQGQCTFTDARTGERCHARHFIEEDHAIPKAMGGEYTVENIRLRCRAHNHRHAIETYGFEKMQTYRH